MSNILTKNIRSVITPSLREFSDAVGCTAGPKGRLVAIRKNTAIPHLTKDGMTVATAFRKDGFEGVAIDMVRQSAIETGKRAGDGTTTASVMSVALYDATEYEGVLDLLEEIDRSKVVDKAIDELTIRVEGYDQLYGVTFTASNGDPDIAEPIASVFHELGPHAAVTVREDRTQPDVVLEKTEGASFPAGFASPYFVANGSNKVVLNNPYIWFSTVSLTRANQVAQVMQAVSLANHKKQESRPLLVIAPSVGEEALSILLVNNSQGRLPCCAISSAFEGSLQVSAVTDLGVICGYKLTSTEIGSTINDTNLEEFLGSAETVVVEAKTSSFVGPSGSSDARAELAAQLHEEIAKPDLTPDEKKNLQVRLGILNGRAAVIRVGGVTPSQITERKDRADDAVSTARWALIEGVLPGAGTALFDIHDRVLEMCDGRIDDESAQHLAEAFVCPFYRVAENAGICDRNSLHMDNYYQLDTDQHFGLDLRSGEVVDLVANLAFDSAYAVREAVKAAVSSAINLARCEAIILQPDEFA